MAAERSGLITFAVVAAAAAGAGLVRARGQALQPDSPARVFDVPSIPAEVARPFSFGMRSLAADLTFLEAIQIHGSRSLKLPEPEARRDDWAMTLLFRYTTDLDEKFAGAYRFTGNALPRHTIDGKVYGVFATEYLLEKGVRERPDDWRISFLLGFIESYYLGKMGEAARHIAHAAQQQGAPGYLGLLAT